MRTFITSLFLVVFFTKNVKGQLTTTQTLTPQQLVQNVLLGGGVTASNITFTGNSQQISKFTATPSTSLGIQSGILISTGNSSSSSADGPQGPNNSSATSTAYGGSGDTYLSTLSNQQTYDAGVLEFDFVASGDTVKFRYVFASEEYPEFVNSINDAFALVLSGSGSTVLAPTNIAIIPTTTSGSNVVSINNINASTNSSYYINNASGFVNTEFDGLTVVLTAKYKVNCGQQYHIKIAIADGSDAQLDSGVFLEAGSFSSLPPLSLNTTNSNLNIPDTILVEGCNSNCINFIRNGNIANADSFNLQISGSAQLGIDYIQSGNPGFMWPTKIYFAANQDTLKFCNLMALQDGLSEGLDTIKFTMSSFASSSVSCLSSNAVNFNFYVKDYTPINIGQNSTSVCSGNSITLDAGATNGYAPYTYTWTAQAVNTATFNTGPINSSQNYTITVNDICNKPVTQQITINPVSTPTIVSTNAVICAGTTATVVASGATTYTWSNGAVNDSIFVNPASNTTYTVTGANGACTNSAVTTVTVIGFSLSITGNNSICLGQSTTLTAAGSPTTYVWSNGTTNMSTVVSPTVTTNYTVSSISTPCSNTAAITVTVTPPPSLTLTGTPYCAGQTTTITATGATSYTWSTGSSTNSIVVSPLGNTTYTVVGSSIPSCTSSVVFTPSLITTAPEILNTSPVVFCLDSIKSITVRVVGGNDPYTINWIIPAGGVVPFDTINYTYYFSQSIIPASETYTIVVTDQCLYNDTLAIDINTINCNIIIPNVVTPNGDGVNDYFKINGLNNFPGSSLIVYNRWGNKIYSNDDYKNDWSPNVTDGSYFYIVNVSDGRILKGFFEVFKN